MTPTQAATFAIAALLLVAIPGPSVIFIIGRTLLVGRAGALISDMGVALGSLAQVALLALGLGTLLTTSEFAFTVVKLLGAAYLIALGVQALRRPRAHDTAAPPSVSPSAAKTTLLRQGLLVGLTNPKTAVFLAAVLPQFTLPNTTPIPLQLTLLGVELIIVGFVSDLVWILSAGAFKTWLGYGKRQRHLETAGGVMLIGLGTYVVVSGPSPP